MKAKTPNYFETIGLYNTVLRVVTNENNGCDPMFMPYEFKNPYLEFIMPQPIFRAGNKYVIKAYLTEDLDAYIICIDDNEKEHHYKVNLKTGKLIK